MFKNLLGKMRWVLLREQKVVSSTLNAIELETLTRELEYKLKLASVLSRITFFFSLIAVSGMLFFNIVRGYGLGFDPNVLVFSIGGVITAVCWRLAKPEYYYKVTVTLTLTIAFVASFSFFQMPAQMPALFLGSLFPILIAQILLNQKWVASLAVYFIVISCCAIFLQDIAKAYVPFFTTNVPNYPYSQMLAIIIMLPAISLLFAIPFQRQNRILREQNRKLIEYGMTLEEKVTERTTELANASTQIKILNEALQAENTRLSTELDIARRLQQMILPKANELENIHNLEIAAFISPATEVGGDYYDVIKWQQDGRLMIGIGDVTGHGLESGVLMLMVQTAIRTVSVVKETELVRFLSIVNEAIYQNIERMSTDKSLTLVLLDYYKGDVCISGQHEEVLVLRNNGKLEKIDTVDLGMPVGLIQDIDNFLHNHRLHLNPNEALILYTDGVTEAKNTAGQYYGLERLCQAIERNAGKSATELKNLIVEDLYKFIGKHEIRDDITLLVLKQK